METEARERVERHIVPTPDESIVELQACQKYDVRSWLTKAIESVGGNTKEKRGRYSRAWAYEDRRFIKSGTLNTERLGTM
jgi:hypothetical protein